MTNDINRIIESVCACLEGGDCTVCKYYDEAYGICKEKLCNEAKGLLSLNLGGRYWDKISVINAKQEIKGRKKYGVDLEENTTLTRNQRIEHLEEELIDALKYCEHLKAIDADGITANDYQRAAMRTAGDNKDSYLLNGVMGLCGEAGEVIDLVKKHLHQGHELDREQLILECGDCAWYLALIASAIDCDLSKVLQRNIDKLQDRYPEGFDKTRSINRNE